MTSLSSIGRLGSFGNSAAISNTVKVAEEAKLQEQKQQQEQTTQKQDLSRGPAQTQTTTNVAYTIVNGKLTLTNKEKADKNVKNDNKAANENKSQNTGTEKEIIKTNETKLYSNFYYNMSANFLTKGITLASAAKGMKIAKTEEKNDKNDAYSFKGKKQAAINIDPENGISTQLLNAKKILEAKVSVKNQDNDVFRQASCLNPVYTVIEV